MSVNFRFTLMLFGFVLGMSACSDDDENGGGDPIGGGTSSLECPENSFGHHGECLCNDGYLSEGEHPHSVCVSRLDKALETENIAYLETIDDALSTAQTELEAISGASESVLRAIYGEGAISYNPQPWSQFVRTGALSRNFGLLLGSVEQQPLATAGSLGDARYVAFGSNPFSIMLDDPASEGFGLPFKRLLSWLTTGEAEPAVVPDITIALAMLGGDESDVMVWMDAQPESLRWTVTRCSDLATLAACVSGAELVVMGDAAEVSESAELGMVAANVLDAGQALFYVHTSTWEATETGSAILKELAMSFGEYGGNYFLEEVGDWASADAMLEAGGLATSVQRMLTHFQAGDFEFDWSECTEWVGQWSCSEMSGFRREFLNGAQMMQAYLNALDRDGVRTFSDDVDRLWRILVLVGDWYRRDIIYPMDKQTTDSTRFLRAYLADHAVAYNRSINPQQPDLGSFSRTYGEHDVLVESHTVDVQISRDGGYTAIGHYAAPGRTFTVERLDDEPVSASVKINTQRIGSTREFDPDQYTRPKFLQSPAMTLRVGEVLHLTSPYGGTLQLVTPATDADYTVKLKLTEVATHAVLENPSEYAAYVQELTMTVIDFTEIKTPYVQIHSRSDMMIEALNQEPYNGDLHLFFEHLNTYMIEDTYNLAGFVGESLSHNTTVTAYCEEAGWDCSSAEIHASPAIQHVNIDAYAHCGGGCSGNPYDQSWVLGPLGWGETHEIGHNLQRPRLGVYDGKSSEVSNQIFPLHKGFQYFADTGIEPSTNSVGYQTTFEWLQQAALTDDPSGYVYDRLWAGEGIYDQNGERMAFYMQVVHTSEDIMVARGGNGWDVYTLMYLLERIVTHASVNLTWSEYKDALGFSDYEYPPLAMSGNDFMLVAMSFITGRDQRPFFDMWGVSYSVFAAGQVEAYGFAEAPRVFYPNTDSSHPPSVDPVPVDGQGSWPLD